MDHQLIGTSEGSDGSSSIMLCIDSDHPNEFMFGWWNPQNVLAEAGGLLADSVWDGRVIKLTPKLLFRKPAGQSLFAPEELTSDEIAWMKEAKAELEQLDDGKWRGTWRGPGSKAGTLSLASTPQAVGPDACSCRTWDEFKRWAYEVRRDHRAVWFRGHGCSSFPLRTSFHRLGRNRLERYCAEELRQFHPQVEASFGRRFKLEDGYDYATVVALAQHHGVPTPLLDWTESPYIAAFFAFSDALEARETRPNSTHVRIFALSAELVSQISPRVVNFSVPNPYVAALSVSPLHNPRLHAQQGCFLVTNVANVEGFIRDEERRANQQHLFAADVPVESAAEAIKDLAYMGLTAATMFPGLDGVGRMIRHSMLVR